MSGLSRLVPRRLRPLAAAVRHSWPPLPRLDRWEPVRMLRTEATDVPRAMPRAIDAHNHLGRWLSRTGDWLAPDVPRLLDAMDEMNLAAIVNADGRWGAELEANLDRYDRAHPGRFATLCHIDWSRLAETNGVTTLARELRRSSDAGAAGVKVWKDLGRTVRDARGALVLPDDPRLADLWDTAGELGLPILIHVADPPAFFRPDDRFNERLEELRGHPSSSWRRRGLPSFERLIEALDTVLGRHPGTTWLAAHGAALTEDLGRLDALLTAHPNLHVDTAGRAADLGRQPRGTARLIAAHPDRVLFGTDVFPVRPDEVRIYFRLFQTADECFDYSTASLPPAGRWTISGLGLEDGLLERVYSANARRLFPSLGAEAATTDR